MRTVLCVEDDRDFGPFLRRFLERQGYRAVVSKTGFAGLEAARTLRPDLIMLDICIPDLDGFQVLKRLRGDPDTARIPVLMMSGVDEASEPFKTAAAAIGDVDFLSKKAGPDELLRKVRETLMPSPGTLPCETRGMLRCGRVRICPDTRKVFVGGKELVGIGPKRFDLLLQLAQHPRGLQKDALKERLWTGDGNAKIVDRTVARLREDFAKAGLIEVLVTIPGGYRLVG